MNTSKIDEPYLLTRALNSLQDQHDSTTESMNAKTYVIAWQYGFMQCFVDFKEPPKPETMFDEKEIYDLLIIEGFDEERAKLLARKWSMNMNKAYNKGFEDGYVKHQVEDHELSK